MPGRADSSRPGREWLVRADHDFETAKLLFDRNGFGEVIAALIQQSIEKYLKGYLLSSGWKLLKTHDLELLTSEAVTHNQDFAEFLDFARALSAVYIESRYPPGLPKEFSSQELSDMLKQAQRLIAKITDLMAK